MTERKPKQLPLFGDSVVRKKVAERPIKLPEKVALAAVTEFFYAEKPSSDATAARVRELLTDLTPRELRETAIGAAWMAAIHLRFIDRFDLGSGAEMLQEFGLILADFEESP
jgi:hypothetical protein